MADCMVSSRPYVSLMDIFFFNVETPEGARLTIHSQDYRRRRGMTPGSLCQQSMSMYEDLFERMLCGVLPSGLIWAEAASNTYCNHEAPCFI